MGIEDSKFECELCTHVLDKSKMSRIQNVCEDCAAQSDGPHDHCL
jgi:hypothetical protein